MRDFAWPSVKLLEPATGAPGLGGVLGELTAGVLASRFAGCAMAVPVIIAAAAAIARYVRILLFLSRCKRFPTFLMVKCSGNLKGGRRAFEVAAYCRGR